MNSTPDVSRALVLEPPDASNLPGDASDRTVDPSGEALD
jgi:hypothetical protein